MGIKLKQQFCLKNLVNYLLYIIIIYKLIINYQLLSMNTTLPNLMFTNICNDSSPYLHIFIFIYIYQCN